MIRFSLNCQFKLFLGLYLQNLIYLIMDRAQTMYKLSHMYMIKFFNLYCQLKLFSSTIFLKNSMSIIMDTAQTLYKLFHMCIVRFFSLYCQLKLFSRTIFWKFNVCYNGESTDIVLTF